MSNVYDVIPSALASIDPTRKQVNLAMTEHRPPLIVVTVIVIVRGAARFAGSPARSVRFGAFSGVILSDGTAAGVGTEHAVFHEKSLQVRDANFVA